MKRKNTEFNLIEVINQIKLTEVGKKKIGINEVIKGNQLINNSLKP